ncbi:hypothetical protein BC835DRAFT_1361738 [Cytidiella melzeri]|nr:hypothetical protein BC835DRAFT_1361738 [Cytidiella melzeri]
MADPPLKHKSRLLAALDDPNNILSTPWTSSDSGETVVGVKRPLESPPASGSKKRRARGSGIYETRDGSSTITSSSVEFMGKLLGSQNTSPKRPKADSSGRRFSLRYDDESVAEKIDTGGADQALRFVTAFCRCCST